MAEVRNDVNEGIHLFFILGIFINWEPLLTTHHGRHERFSCFATDRIWAQYFASTHSTLPSTTCHVNHEVDSAVCDVSYTRE